MCLPRALARAYGTVAARCVPAAARRRRSARPEVKHVHVPGFRRPPPRTGSALDDAQADLLALLKRHPLGLDGDVALLWVAIGYISHHHKVDPDVLAFRARRRPAATGG